ncbi:type II toxin-antitoxin system HicB family antitoxin [Serratia symbiotica]|uniref:Type II toxin-antitoxin system HicB family antitoxin n=1 Tax=Serratia symbiotica TaxID=138074 RepID=A0A068ZCV6_9GAMM|nr:type II toxin-antitoxin system HicB family antitoxin [Serratia symbiotica]MBF1996666.1 type II toxin-antitoxin system HicB family antitoxin [Serratia symbiotica]MBQ0954526.1 type II toxin-antitoxin system HicB family antitoxin [Serratia symbiotica]QLH63587.1 type II toxin-antitoxin system HicB family antitoxin [Serratia symbiotica]CDS58932.1 putative DNA-binding transcriptional regulator [Serratia symbiotica]
MRYPVKFEHDETGWCVSFPDIPEALTGGDTREEAIEMAQDALVTAFDFYFEDRRPVPMPSANGEEFIDVPASVAAKVLLLNAMIATGTTPAQLARRLGTRPQEVNRIVTLNHATKIDTIEAALKALGKRLEITVL